MDSRWIILISVVLFCGLMATQLVRSKRAETVKVNVITDEMKKEIEETLSEVLVSLEELGETSPLRTPAPHIQAVISEIKKIYPDAGSAYKGSKTADKKPEQDVCPEKYAYDKLNGGFPYFYNGFNMVNCTGVPKFSSILTLVYNFVGYSEENLKRVPAMLSAVNKEYPGLSVIAGAPASLSLTTQKNITLVTFNSGDAEMDIWRQLVAKVSTKYVYIGRDAVHFSQFDRLERLVREVNNLDVYAVASAIRGYKSGHWTKGCDQSRLRSYSLVYKSGYEMSKEECIFCHYVHGPFVTKKEYFTKFPLPSAVSAVSGFAMWFLSLVEKKKGIISCPDSMAFVTDESREHTSHNDWTGLVKALQVERIRPANSSLMEFSCEEAGTSCAKMSNDLALSICCRKTRLALVQLVISHCTDGVVCELHNSSLLGALKFNSFLPWQADTDILVYADNLETFHSKLEPLFKEKGYSLKMASNKQSSEIKVDGWSLRLLHSTKTTNKGVSTQILFEGVNMPVPENPGLSALKRFGEDLYRHVQYSQGLVVSGSSDDKVRTFPKCSKPGHHACLDRWPIDGNLQF